MKWMIASDIHGSAYYCRLLMQAFDRERADRLLLLGDLLYHGPRNSLPRDYDPPQVIQMLNEKKDARWIRWCFPSRCWRIMPCCRWIRI